MSIKVDAAKCLRALAVIALVLRVRSVCLPFPLNLMAVLPPRQIDLLRAFLLLASRFASLPY